MGYLDTGIVPVYGFYFSIAFWGIFNTVLRGRKPLFGFIVRGLMLGTAILNIAWQSNLTPAVPSLSVYRRLYAGNLRRPRTPLAWMKRLSASQTDSARW